jgi:hypothetical protein
MQLLQDTFIIENLQVLSEGKTDGKMRVAGVFGRCNEKNNNGRIYPTAVLEGQLKKIQPMISERRLCGELDHPQNDSVKLSNASHLITKLEMKGDELIGEAELLNTPAGLTAQALVKGGVKIGISSRGMGTLSEDQNGDKIVNEDFRLVTFDLVADPSTRGAYPGLTESTQSQFVRETVGKLEKERNFVTLLESKMRDAYAPVLEEAKKKKAKKKKAKEGPTDDGDGMDPVGQGDADIDNDGDSDSSDKYLMNRRKAIAAAMKNEGSWHQIAYALADRMNLTEGVADTLAGNDTQKKQAPESLVKTAIRQRMERKGAEKTAISKAKADVKADRIRGVGAAKTKGKVDRATAAETKKTERAANAPSLSDRAKSAAGAVKKGASAVKKGAEAVTKGAEKFGERLGKAKVRGMQQQQAKRNNAERSKADRDARLAAASKPKTSDSGAKPTAEAPKKDAVNPALRARLASLRARGNAPKENPNIAGPKGKLPEWAIYKMFGNVIAEALGLK